MGVLHPCILVAIYPSMYPSIHPSVYRSGPATAAHRAQVDADIEVKRLGRGRQNAPALAHELHAVNLLVRDEHGRLVHIEEGLLQGVQVAVVSLRSRTGQGTAQDVRPAAPLSALAVCSTYTHCPFAASHAVNLDICLSTPAAGRVRHAGRAARGRLLHLHAGAQSPSPMLQPALKHAGWDVSPVQHNATLNPKPYTLSPASDLPRLPAVPP